MKQQTDALEIATPGITDLGFSYYDSRTFFHRRHVSEVRSRSAEQRLTPERLRMIRDSLATAVPAAGLLAI
jgi:hypothetical protein